MKQLGQPMDAVLAGQVFVNDKRCQTPNAMVETGSRVEVFCGQQSVANVQVLSSREGLIAVNKPAGLSTIPDHRGSAASLLGIVAKEIGEHDPTRIHPTSRLDRDVSGVVILALGHDAREAMRGARTRNRYRRHYVALAANPPTPQQGRIDIPIGSGHKAMVRATHGRDAQHAATRFATIQTHSCAAMVAAEPETGRTHQIRVHLSHAGAPLLGDGKYGGVKVLRLPTGKVVSLERIALHAAWVEVELPGGEVWRVDAPIPETLSKVWMGAGGVDQDWHEAIEPLVITEA